MKQSIFNSSGDLDIAPAADSAPGDFDFLVGSWKIHNRKLKNRLAGCREWEEFEATGECRKILAGFGNIDSFCTDAGSAPFEGMTLRLFNPLTRLWSIYWADSRAVTLDVPQIGSFKNHTGDFYARDVFAGKNIIVRFKWEAGNPDAPVWSQAFSPDNGVTWEWNWQMNFEHR